MSATMRLYMFSFIPLWGMSQGLQPVIGANFGAKQYGRVKDTMKIFMYGATILAVRFMDTINVLFRKITIIIQCEKGDY